MSDHDVWSGVGRARELGPGDEMSPAELEQLDEWSLGDLSVGDLGELIRTRYTERGYTVVVAATKAGWLASAVGPGGDVVHARIGVTLEHALEELIGGGE